MTAFVNLLSAGAAFGVLVLVFQRHWAEGLLGFHSTGALINWIPLFTFAVLFGPLTRVLPGLSPEQRDEVRSALEAFFRGHDGPQGITLPAANWLVQARASRHG